MSLFNSCEDCVIHAPYNNNDCKTENHFETANSSTRKVKRRTGLVFIIVLLLVLLGTAAVFIFSGRFNTLSFGSTKHNRSISHLPLHLTALNEGPKPKRHKVHYEDYSITFKQIESPKVFWESDASFIYTDSSGDLIKFTILPNGSLAKPEMFLLKKQLEDELPLFNSDASYVALKKQIAKTPFEQFTVRVASVQDNNVGVFHSVGISHGSDPLQYFEWSPVRESSDFIFIHSNNMFYQPGIGQKDGLIQLSDSRSAFLSFGVADYMSSESIYGESKPIWWSSSGRFIAYASFDVRNVSVTWVPYYRDDVSQPHMHPLRCARPGDSELPQVLLWIWDKVEQTKQFAMPSERFFNDGPTSLKYLVWAQWATIEPFGEFLLTVWTNRVQNFIAAMICMMNEPCFRFFKFKYTVSGKNLWLEPTKRLQIKYTTKTGFFLILPRQHSNGEIYDGIAHIDISQVQVGRPRYNVRFHNGAFDVHEIVGYDAEQDDLFFTAQGGIIGEMHLFRVPTASGANGIVPQCITCPIEECKFTTVIFSPSSRRMLLNCERAFMPSVMIVKSTDQVVSNVKVKYIQSEINLSNEQSTIKYEVVKLPNGMLANVQLIMPPNFDSELVYPVILDIDGDPGSNNVWKKTPHSYLLFLSMNYHAIVIKIDARGSSLRGWRLKSSVLHNLGGPDVDDKLECLGRLMKRFPYLDSTRVTVMGRGYGGFIALQMAAKDGGAMIKCLALRSPITSFMYQGAAFSERYLHMPSDNEEGYETSSMINKNRIDSIKDIKIFLAHGGSDRHVQYQNSALLAKHLQKINVHFVQVIYPNEDYDLDGVLSHFYNEQENFLASECFS
ncbi:unnamed protein product [Bursaphelenchus xylophilus]|uniref:(pine wood nematode) hypothetical protein n=1 Tax=Bursaphelenchus xylophilus TaxID=6326 RepID=A0A1I7STU5_BURXY|nr:unnamed protein product [Bursaphelenchus xylophilus]CAG9107952.1 unnamed protein product [Bursaphelenchus xylophilus]